ncbi:MAG: hypothetical protein ACOY3P_26430 [Planctomycetota bacterium]
MRCGRLGLLPVGCVLLVIAGILPAAAVAQVRSRKPAPRVLLNLEREYLVPASGPESPLKPGLVIELLFLTGKRSEKLELVEVVPGREEGALQALAVKGPGPNEQAKSLPAPEASGGVRFRSVSGAPQQLQAAAVARILVDGREPYEVLFDAEKKSYVVLDQSRRDQVVAKRLKGTGDRPWKEPTEAEQKTAVEGYKQHLKEVESKFPRSRFTLHETEYFLFHTDLPASQIGGYVARLDAMYDNLCQLYGVRAGTNIWRGKCVIVAFLRKEDFANYEQILFGRSEVGNAAGLCHNFHDGRVIVSCFRGDDPMFFASMLVHETSHGFCHRYRSTINFPSWIDEGIADWVAGVVVPQCRAVPVRQQEALDYMRQSRNMAGMFAADGPDFQTLHYGMASRLTHMMLSADPTRYRALLTAIKEGLPWREALRQVYSSDEEQLAQNFGRSLKIVGLRP